MARGSGVELDPREETRLDIMNDTKKFLAAIAVVLIVIVALCIGISDNVQQIAKKNFSATTAAREAVQAHDIDEVNRYVDIDALIEQAAAEILSAQINATTAPTAYSMDALKIRYDELKPDFVTSARSAVDEYIAAGKITYPDAPTAAQKFFRDSGLGSCEIVSITRPHIEGNVQTSTVIVHNAKMNFNFELELDLEADAEGNWRVTKADGFDGYYTGYRRALRRKLDSLNAPIAAQMDEIFVVQSFKARVTDGDEYGFSRTLELLLKADVKSDKPLDKIIGTVSIGKDERESIAPFVIDMTDRAQGVQSIAVTKTLNPFVRADVDAMKHGLNPNDIRIEVTEIIFADGTELKQLDRLPE